MSTVKITDPRTGQSASLDYTWPPAPPAPPLVTTLFGCSVSTRGDTQAAAWARVNAALAPQITRLYDNQKGLSTSLARAKACGWPVVPTHISCEYGPDFADGRYDGEFLSAALQLTARDFWTVDHEMDAKVHDGKYTAATFAARWRYFAGLARRNGVKARAVQVFTGYDIANRMKALYVGDDWCELIGVDPYVHAATETAQSKIAPILAAIGKVTTKPVAVCETGAKFSNPSGYVASLAWLKGKVAYVCWFNSVDTVTQVSYSIDADPVAAALYRGLRAG